ncbi:MAG: bifunctional precorrin-2 dehydrogenase/sirohydrochlorin ferrochelatase [Desulfobacteria bacterium]
MRYYPINLDVQNRECLVVGGGGVGERKVKTLLECGALVTVVTTDATEALQALASERSISLKTREYEPSDMEGKFLVIGATDNEEVNEKISKDAAERELLCNIADRPAACNFVLPAIARQGDLLIAISTSNKSPAVARRIRQNLEKEFGPEYALLLNLMGAIRQKLLSESKSPEAHKRVFELLLDEGLLEMIRENRTRDVDALLKDVLGNGYTWKELMRVDELSGSLASA